MDIYFGLCFQANVSENLSCFYACFETPSETFFMFSKCISKYLCIAFVLNQVFEVCFETFILCFETSFPESYILKLIGVCFETSFPESYVSKPIVVCVETSDSISKSFQNQDVFCFVFLFLFKSLSIILLNSFSMLYEIQIQI